jgi:hypothetical protein
MSNVYGVDTSIYPGKPTLNWYWSRCGFRYTGFYLGPAPYHTDKTWMNARDELAADGWGFLPTYVGLQIGNRNLGVARGEKDGQQAARLMGQAGFPTQTICYLDLEDGTVPSGSYAKYIGAWVRTLRSADYVPGIYCSHRIADWCRAHTPYLWTFRIPYCTSGRHYHPDELPQGMIAAGAHATQYRQNVFVRGNRTQVDLNVSYVADPSNLASVMHALGLG